MKKRQHYEHPTAATSSCGGGYGAPAILPLAEDKRQQLVDDLMTARRKVKDAKGDKAAIADARRQVDKVQIGLGERVQVWWDDGAPDLNRHLVRWRSKRRKLEGIVCLS